MSKCPIFAFYPSLVARPAMDVAPARSAQADFLAISRAAMGVVEKDSEVIGKGCFVIERHATRPVHIVQRPLATVERILVPTTPQLMLLLMALGHTHLGMVAHVPVTIHIGLEHVSVAMAVQDHSGAMRRVVQFQSSSLKIQRRRKTKTKAPKRCLQRQARKVMTT